MNDKFRLTSKEYAKVLGISAEALRSRRRRQIETNYIQDKFGNYWWKNDRPIKGAVNVNDHPKKNGLFRDPGAKKIDTRKRRRGVHTTGQETNYHNARNGWQLEELNLARRRMKLDDDLKKHDFTDEEIIEILESGKKKVVEKKEAKLKKTMEEAEAEEPLGQPTSTHGTNKVDPRHGKFMDRLDWNEEIRHDRARSLKRYEAETNTKFITKEKTDMFGFKHKVKIPDFSTNQPYEFRNPYGDGMFDDEPKGTVVLDMEYSRSSLPANEFGYTKPRNFGSKVDEAIWDAEQRLKNKKY